MVKTLNLLIDTDIFIDYFNHQLFSDLFENKKFRVFYSVVTKKELLSKAGLTDAERKSINQLLSKYRIVSLEKSIVGKYSELRHQFPSSHKEDCLIAATAIIKKFYLATRNLKHFKIFPGLTLYL
jgi:predicted nucleic acid-binding protein